MRLRDIKDELKKAAGTIEVQSETIKSQYESIDKYEEFIEQLGDITTDIKVQALMTEFFSCEDCGL